MQAQQQASPAEPGLGCSWPYPLDHVATIIRKHVAIATEAVAKVAPRRISEDAGPVAQWLEPTAHNGLVGGSSPPGPTTHSFELGNFPLCSKRLRTGGGRRRWGGVFRHQIL